MISAALFIFVMKLSLLSSCHCQEIYNKTIRVNSVQCGSGHCEVNGVCCDIQQALDKVEDDVEIVVETDSYLSSFVDVCHKTRLHIHGANGHKPFQVHCLNSSLAGIGFFQVTSLSLSNLIITNCGGSTNFSNCSQDPQSIRVAAIYLNNCSNIGVTGVTIRNTNGTGMFMEELRGQVMFAQAIFASNQPNTNEQGKSPWSGGGMTIFINEQHTSLHIINCSFINNSIRDTTTKAEDMYMYEQVDEGHGGGLYLNVSNSECQVTISGTNFTNNKSPYGGGVSIILHEKVSNASIEVSDCLIVSNHATGSIMSNGGGMQLFFFCWQSRDKQHDGGENNIVF